MDITSGFFYVKSEGKTIDNSRVKNGNLGITELIKKTRVE